MTITIRDVAQAAGVSTATVSRALRGLPHVDPVTRERVRKIAQDMDYVVSPSASRLASGRTGTIAVITPYIARWFFATLLSGIESALRSVSVDLLVFEVGDPTQAQGIPAERRLRGRVDGLLVVALPTDAPAVVDLLRLGLPVSLIGAASPGMASVAIDDVAAGRIATQHLINLGHERIGLISGQQSPTLFTAEHHRGAGYREAMQGAGLTVDPDLDAHGYFTISGGEAAMTRLLAQPNPPTAVFAMSDEMAFGALRAMQRHGLKPGTDIAIVGVDGHDLAELLDLTTVAQPVSSLGSTAAEALLAQLRGEGEPAATTIPTRLEVRGSTVPLDRAISVL